MDVNRGSIRNTASPVRSVTRTSRPTSAGSTSRFGSFDDVRRRHRLALRRDRLRVDLRHVDDILEEPRQSLDFLLNDRDLLRPLLGGQLWRRHIGRGDPDGRQGRSQVVADRRKERAPQVRGSLHDFRLAPLIEQREAFDGDCGHAGDRIARPGIGRRALNHQQAEDLRASTDRDDGALRAVRPRLHLVAGVRPRVRVELQRGARSCHHSIEVGLRFAWQIRRSVLLPAVRPDDTDEHLRRSEIVAR